MMYPVIATFLFRSGARWLLLALLGNAGGLALEFVYAAERITGRSALPRLYR